MSKHNLKPCPFCGGEPRDNEGGNSVYGRFWWAVWCDECQIEMRDREVWSKTDHGRLDPDFPAQECFKRWNQRATEPSERESA